MEAMYLIIGLFLGAFAGVAIMSMFAVSKRADESATEINSKLTPIISHHHQETTT